MIPVKQLNRSDGARNDSRKKRTILPPACLRSASPYVETRQHSMTVNVAGRSEGAMRTPFCVILLCYLL